MHMMCTIHIMPHDQSGRDQPDSVTGLDYELTLLGRHEALPVNTRRGGQVLERSAFMLLSRLEVQQPMSQRELADAFRLDVSTINRQTAALLRQGLVEQVLDPAGGTARKLRPTPDGLAQLIRDRAYFQSILVEVIADWPEEDRLTFLRLLRRFNIDMETHHGTPWPRGGEQAP